MACAGVCSSAAWTLQWRAACLVDEGKTLATRLVSARLPRPLAPPQSSPMERALAAMVMRQTATMRHTARLSCATGGREPRGRVLAAQRAECAQLSSCADGGHCAQRLRLGARCEHGSPLSHCGATHQWRRPSDGHAERGRADGRSARQDSAWRSGAASRERRQPRLWIGARHCAGDVWKLALAVPVEAVGGRLGGRLASGQERTLL